MIQTVKELEGETKHTRRNNISINVIPAQQKQNTKNKSKVTHLNCARIFKQTNEAKQQTCKETKQQTTKKNKK